MFDEVAGRYVDTDSSVADIVTPTRITEEFQSIGSDGDMVRLNDDYNLVIKRADGIVFTYSRTCTSDE